VDRLSTSARLLKQEPDPSAVLAGAVLTIDLAAIRANYRLLRERLGGAGCAAVVKADAYGLGAAKVAPALLREGCDRFFVAQVGEGIALRAVLPGPVDILVLNGLPPGAEADCAAAGLTPVLNSLEQLAAWRAHARRRGQTLAAALQVDSGMSRLGMQPSEVATLAADPDTLKGLSIRLVMSHLACADEPAHPANAMQRVRFEALRAQLPAAPASLANSSGIFLGAPFAFDLARPGAALYGINPTPAQENPMRPVVGLSARIVQLRDVPAGEGVGYGHTFITKRPMRLATISIGYADGWHRRAASCAYFGKARLPFVGRVSMDSIIVDASSVAAGPLSPGDSVELIGEHQTVDDVAGHAGTIGYEVLTGLGARFHRIYRDA
jgi:alanine racemase